MIRSYMGDDKQDVPDRQPFSPIVYGGRRTACSRQTAFLPHRLWGTTNRMFQCRTRAGRPNCVRLCPQGRGGGGSSVIRKKKHSCNQEGNYIKYPNHPVKELKKLLIAISPAPKKAKSYCHAIPLITPSPLSPSSP